MTGCAPRLDIPVVRVAGDPFVAAKSDAAAGLHGTLCYYGIGESMSPWLPDDTAVVVRKVPFSKLRTGMVIVYCNLDNMRVAHQIMEIRGEGLVTKGFNNRIPDKTLVTERMYVGVVACAYRALTKK